MLKVVISSDHQGEGKSTIGESIANILRFALATSGSRRTVELIDNANKLTKRKEKWYRDNGCKVLIHIEANTNR